MPKTNFHKVAKQLPLHWCFLVNLLYIFRTPFLRTPVGEDLFEGVLRKRYPQNIAKFVCAKYAEYAEV